MDHSRRVYEIRLLFYSASVRSCIGSNAPKRMFQRPIICTDCSDGLQRFTAFVPQLAAGGVQQIVFFHNLPFREVGGIPRVDTERTEQAHQQLESALQQVPEGIEVKVEVQSGKLVDNLLKVAKTYQADVFVLGMASRNILNQKLFGSTTVELSQRTKTPILALRPQLISAYTSEELALRCQHLFRYLLIPYDGSDTSSYLLQQIKQYASNRPASSLECCLLCWVVDDTGRRELDKEHRMQLAQQKLTAAKAELEHLQLRVDVELRRGEPVVELLEAAQYHDISAIAIASNNLGKIWELPIASFTGEVLRRSWHPVLFFSM